MSQRQSTNPVDVAVVGGGLAGLSAACYLARAGHSVVLLERAATLGGRASTQRDAGFAWNLGPHALYRKGAGAAVLAELGISYRAGRPDAAGGFALRAGRAHTLPGGFVSLLTTGLIGIGAKLELGRLLGSFQRENAADLDGMSVADWLRSRIRHAGVRELLSALVRLTTYANADGVMSAGAAVRQIQLALGSGVVYIDDGWQTLVDGLARVARDAGVELRSGERVVAVESTPRECEVRLSGGGLHRARAVLLALPPESVVSLLGDACPEGLRAWAGRAQPARAACLDLALTDLPRPHARFALGIDEPTYLSVHSAVARLAPAGGATVHVAKYLAAGLEGDPRRDERELEAVMDLVQPGWRQRVHARRFLPSMTVMSALPLADRDGAAGRPSVSVGEASGIFVAGDWVGASGLLADTSLASAKRASEACSAHLHGLIRRAA
jgi:phytoene dehydrogenase-like protein